MIYLMNSAVMPSRNYGTFVYGPASLDDLKDVMAGKHGPITSCIGYPQNVELIRNWTGIKPDLSRAEITFQHGDRALVMRLTRRVDPTTKGMPVSNDPVDWEFAWVDFIKE